MMSDGLTAADVMAITKGNDDGTTNLTVANTGVEATVTNANIVITKLA